MKPEMKNGLISSWVLWEYQSILLVNRWVGEALSNASHLQAVEVRTCDEETKIIHQSLVDIHLDIAIEAERRQLANQMAQKGVQPALLNVGDMVLWAKVDVKLHPNILRTGKRNDGVNAVLVRDSVDPNVLEALVDWAFKVGSEEDVTDEMLMTFVNKQCEDGAVDGNAGTILRVFADLEMNFDT
uniref:AlNc14C142G7278 protein n=1 Tax=Albugo laibachii Nc14 TaxID=890382 RepID=F0WL89_9STRA|nr:AlNc14C142G7278 [Albugo laibachii Nc14]|eukprot:CCA22051.1 AlNc14C142G7278 [Albugo laibachii Nc14]